MPSTSIWSKRELGAEGEARQDGELVRGIEAADVEGRIGLGVAALLRLLQHVAEGAVLGRPSCVRM